MAYVEIKLLTQSVDHGSNKISFEFTDNGGLIIQEENTDEPLSSANIFIQYSKEEVDGIVKFLNNRNSVLQFNHPDNV